MSEKTPTVGPRVGPQVDRSPTRTNGGASVGYDASVERRGRPTKAEVESLLESRSESISARLAALQKEVTDSRDSVRRAFSENLWIGAGVALVGGLVVGAVLTRRRRLEAPEEKGPDELASLVTRSVRSALEQGVDPTPEVAGLLDAMRAARPTAPDSGGGSRHSLLRSVGFTLLNYGIRTLLSRVGGARADAKPDADGQN